MYDCTRRCRRFVFEGNELLRLYVSYAIIEDNATIGDFYSNLAKRVEKFCESEYFPRLCEEFKKEPRSYSIKKYRFSAEVADVTEKTVELFLEVSTSSNDRGNDAMIFFERHRWSLENSMIIK